MGAWIVSGVIIVIVVTLAYHELRMKYSPPKQPPDIPTVASAKSDLASLVAVEFFEMYRHAHQAMEAISDHFRLGPMVDNPSKQLVESGFKQLLPKRQEIDSFRRHDWVQQNSISALDSTARSVMQELVRASENIETTLDTAMHYNVPIEMRVRVRLQSELDLWEKSYFVSKSHLDKISRNPLFPNVADHYRKVGLGPNIAEKVRMNIIRLTEIQSPQSHPDTEEETPPKTPPD